MAPRRPVPSVGGRRGDGHCPRHAERRRLVVCAGGGGVPVRADHDTGALTGVEAVVDKDFTAVSLLILTDVPNVYADFGTPRQQPVLYVAPQLRDRAFPEDSMKPKTEAAARSVERTGGLAAVGSLDAAYAIVHGTSGTFVRPELPIG
ncbi:Carbamate kinase 2 [Streptomyces sp. enrichment culture]